MNKKERTNKLSVKFPEIRKLMQECFSNGRKPICSDSESLNGDFAEQYMKVEKIITEHDERMRDEVIEEMKKEIEKEITVDSCQDCNMCADNRIKNLTTKNQK